MLYSTLQLFMNNIAVKDFSTNSTLIKIDDPRDANEFHIRNINISDAIINRIIESEMS